MAQWIRHLTTDQGIPGSNPGGVASFLFGFIGKCSRSSPPYLAPGDPFLELVIFSLPWPGRNNVCPPLGLQICGIHYILQNWLKLFCKTIKSNDGIQDFANGPEHDGEFFILFHNFKRCSFYVGSWIVDPHSV